MKWFQGQRFKRKEGLGKRSGACRQCLISLMHLFYFLIIYRITEILFENIFDPSGLMEEKCHI